MDVFLNRVKSYALLCYNSHVESMYPVTIYERVTMDTTKAINSAGKRYVNKEFSVSKKIY